MGRKVFCQREVRKTLYAEINKNPVIDGVFVEKYKLRMTEN